jgi:rRNA biogenesis protein RRP5
MSIPVKYADKAMNQISRVSDDHLTHLSPTSGPFRPGTAHRARVVGYSAVDNLVQISFQASATGAKYFRVEDVEVGARVKGTIQRLTEKAVFIKLSHYVDGVVWPIHYPSTKLKSLEKRYKPDSPVNARVSAFSFITSIYIPDFVRRCSPFLPKKNELS